ncbi:MAG TPA: hypothetical protein ENJ09_03405 [Planctomycetes bacterium]|nr:hypothetical protein [Planctomycetota bacterium]
MRSRIPILLLGAVLSSCSVGRFHARQEVNWFRSGFYGGAMAGVASTGDSSADLDRALAKRGYSTDSSLDDSDSAYNIYGGYRFESSFAVELGYVNLGQTSSTINATPPDLNLFLDDVADVHPVLGRGFQLCGRWFAVDRERVNLSVSAGFWVWNADIDAQAGTGEVSRSDRSGIDPTIGVAATLGLTDRLDLRAAWDRYYLDGDSADAFWLGVQWGVL